MTSTFLICGNDLDLLRTRALILRHAGFSTVEADRSAHLDLSRIGSDLLGAVFCHTLTAEQKKLYTQCLHDRWPDLPLLQLIPISIQSSSLMPFSIPVLATPAGLVDACKRVSVGQPPTPLPTEL